MKQFLSSQNPGLLLLVLLFAHACRFRDTRKTSTATATNGIGRIVYYIHGGDTILGSVRLNPFAQTAVWAEDTLWTAPDTGGVQIHAQEGTTQQLRLPGCCSVTLNGGTRLALQANDTCFQAALCGEAYFHRDHAPKNLLLKVGPHTMFASADGDFAVSAYPGDRTIQASSINSLMTIDGVPVLKGKLFTAQAQSNAFQVANTDTASLLPGWLSGDKSWHFERAAAAAILGRLASEYGVGLCGPATPDRRDFTGTVSFDRPVDSLTALEEMLGVHWQVSGGCLNVTK